MTLWHFLNSRSYQAHINIYKLEAQRAGNGAWSGSLGLAWPGLWCMASAALWRYLKLPAPGCSSMFVAPQLLHEAPPTPQLLCKAYCCPAKLAARSSAKLPPPCDCSARLPRPVTASQNSLLPRWLRRLAHVHPVKQPVTAAQQSPVWPHRHPPSQWAAQGPGEAGLRGAPRLVRSWWYLALYIY